MSKKFRSFYIAVFVQFLCVVGARADGSADPYATVQGMTITCPRAGQVWGTDLMVETMAKLKAMGVNWVTIHPYGGISGNGNVGRGMIDRLYQESRWLTRAIDEAHALGLKIMIKPHIAYWGSPFGWRGEIEFHSDEDWDRFFYTYNQWITKVAEVTRNADAFVVGTELDRTVHFEDQWRAIIGNIRALTDAPLTYAAGWDRYEEVHFWDDLDVIGIQAYFPLADHEDPPSQQALDEAWSELADRLEGYADKLNRKILFTELGYNRSLHAAVRPWEYRQHRGADAEAIQVRCTRAALAALERSDVLVGAFMWKWFPGEGNYGNFIQSSPAVRSVIADFWNADDLK